MLAPGRHWKLRSSDMRRKSNGQTGVWGPAPGPSANALGVPGGLHRSWSSTTSLTRMRPWPRRCSTSRALVSVPRAQGICRGCPCNERPLWACLAPASLKAQPLLGQPRSLSEQNAGRQDCSCSCTPPTRVGLLRLLLVRDICSQVDPDHDKLSLTQEYPSAVTC